MDDVDILACPTTGQRLRPTGDGAGLTTADGATTYRATDGIARLLPSDAKATGGTQEFYEEAGWNQTEDGVFTDTTSFVDTRSVPFGFTRQCMQRLARHFRRGGDYLLDAGSGPIPHDELLAYGDHFKKRICVDLSVSALRAARIKLGERGVYLQGDLTRLPLQTGSVDAVTCNHVIYQIPDAEDQAAAFRELWRVLKPGGKAVVAYWWEQAPLAWRAERVARLIWTRREQTGADKASPTAREPCHAPQSLAWFEAQKWPFRYRFEPYRIVTNQFMREYVTDDWRGRLFLKGLFALQSLAPTTCGKYGALPVIVIYKD